MCKWQCPVTEECTTFVLGDDRVCMCLLRLILRQNLKEECSVQLCMRKCVL